MLGGVDFGQGRAETREETNPAVGFEYPGSSLHNGGELLAWLPIA